MNAKLVGKPVSRVDGRLKVTDRATYAADTRIDKLAHAALVVSTIAKGKIERLDTAAAEKASSLAPPELTIAMLSRCGLDE